MKDKITFYKNRFHYFILISIFNVREIPKKIRRKIWNRGILLWWYRLWVRKDEFSNSLSLDLEAMWDMDEKELARYREDVLRRRQIAHKRD